VHAAAREGSLEALQYLRGAGFGMAGGCSTCQLQVSAVFNSWADLTKTVIMLRYPLCPRLRLVSMLEAAPSTPMSPWFAELDSEGKLPLHHAAIGYGQVGAAARRGADHSRVADALLAAGCAPDAADTHGCTPLHFAAGARGRRTGKGRSGCCMLGL
jgi:hypothetical protein